MSKAWYSGSDRIKRGGRPGGKGIEDETAYTCKEDEITGGDDEELLSRSLVVRQLLLAPKWMEQSQHISNLVYCEQKGM